VKSIVLGILPVSPELKEAAANLALALGYDPAGTSDSSAVDVHPDLVNHPEYLYSALFITDMAPLIAGLLVSDPVKAVKMASAAVDDVPLFPVEYMGTNPAFIPEFATTIATALWYNIYGTGDLFIKTHGAMPLDNTECVYEYYPYGSGNDFEVERFTARPSAEKYLEHWYKPDGELTIPVVTLHITRDPAVPFRHETAYASASGIPSAFLTQIPIEGFGHGILMADEYGGPIADPLGKTLEKIFIGLNILVGQVTGSPLY